MPAVKLVVIGASGVGKTSFRTQYISGRFSTGYRTTIGADFISKTFPNPSNPHEVVTLQIWDTAGQERFSSLSTAFFRGADAALLMFDVNQPETLTSLTKWWAEFRERAPLFDEDMEDYCCVVVGNKTDLVNSNTHGMTSVVSEVEALRFLDELIPPSSPPPLCPVEEVTIAVEEFTSGDITSPHHESDMDLSSILRSRSIDINRHDHLGSYSKSRSRSGTRFNNGTMTSTHTALTSYHTPSSSLFDVYASARSSPFPPSISSRPSSPVRAPRRVSSSLSSTSSSSAPTITPSLFTRDQAAATTPPTLTLPSPASETMPLFPPPPERGPKLFFTSAKTGEGVREVFEYIAQRVVARWEYEDAIDARTLHVQGTNSTGTETIRLGLAKGESNWRPSGSCCGK
ncbi:hypothetical protein PAXINDRAFT_99225 [Paxillus involutus ATCC 200175]|uniref:Ras-domain-containing protein n=1 Tax=Paxillus involutus ATCC 200175 TaxID=664439 RepID=A0A0C9T090_PAXIN|nr:hypothetical protein PAXINDRAFT_99225 [Paxillus involutus ATCC 200175]